MFLNVLYLFFFLLDETPKNEEKIIERHIKETNKKSISIVVFISSRHQLKKFL